MNPRARTTAIRLARGGLGHREIARRLEVNRKTVERWLSPEFAERLRQAGLTRRRRQAAARRGKPPVVISVDIDPLRKAVLRCEQFGTTRSEICERIGWTPADTSKLARGIGVMPGQRTGTLATTIPEPLAVAILHAINLDPVDVGI